MPAIDRSVPACRYILILTFMFVFIFTILGMQMFGGLFINDDDTPRWNFDTFPVAMFTTFQVMTYDSWNAVMVDTIRAGNISAMVRFCHFYHHCVTVFHHFFHHSVTLSIIVSLFSIILSLFSQHFSLRRHSSWPGSLRVRSF